MFVIRHFITNTRSISCSDSESTVTNNSDGAQFDCMTDIDDIENRPSNSVVIRTPKRRPTDTSLSSSIPGCTPPVALSTGLRVLGDNMNLQRSVQTESVASPSTAHDSTDSAAVHTNSHSDANTFNRSRKCKRDEKAWTNNMSFLVHFPAV